MMESGFSEQEAKALVGHTFEVMIALTGVPRGTVGRVIEAIPVGSNWNIEVEWELPGTSLPMRGFSKAETHEFLQELTATVEKKV